VRLAKVAKKRVGKRARPSAERAARNGPGDNGNGKNGSLQVLALSINVPLLGLRNELFEFRNARADVRAGKHNVGRVKGLVLHYFVVNVILPTTTRAEDFFFVVPRKHARAVRLDDSRRVLRLPRPARTQRRVPPAACSTSVARRATVHQRRRHAKRQSAARALAGRRRHVAAWLARAPALNVAALRHGASPRQSAHGKMVICRRVVVRAAASVGGSAVYSTLQNQPAGDRAAGSSRSGCRSASSRPSAEQDSAAAAADVDVGSLSAASAPKATTTTAATAAATTTTTTTTIRANNFVAAGDASAVADSQAAATAARHCAALPGARCAGRAAAAWQRCTADAIDAAAGACCGGIVAAAAAR
jgi:hypothetical protein